MAAELESMSWAGRKKDGRAVVQSEREKRGSKERQRGIHSSLAAHLCALSQATTLRSPRAFKKARVVDEGEIIEAALLAVADLEQGGGHTEARPDLGQRQQDVLEGGPARHVPPDHRRKEESVSGFTVHNKNLKARAGHSARPFDPRACLPLPLSLLRTPTPFMPPQCVV
jgi:hypothetical protein